MSVGYQQVTVTLVVKEEDVESVKREINITLDLIDEEYGSHNVEVVSDDCDDPEEEEDLFEYEDAA